MFWYHEEVERLERKEVLPKGEKLRVLFYGSSSIRLWPNLEEDFSELDIINQGFGGSTLAACCWFFKRLVPQYKPDIIVFYGGDNDLGDGRHPEEVFIFFKEIMGLIKEFCGDIPVGFISVKPSFNREYLLNSIDYTNKIIGEEITDRYPNCQMIDVYTEMYAINKVSGELFESDGLHMTEVGYDIWRTAVKEQFLNRFISESFPIDKTPKI
ncbi:lipase [Neptunitalea chrysea]|uniref:Lipase n=1 Tax=Neptunitalea chrysea TaxID=1647581 RepID=A0A9W6B5A8_9FLAO|nr:GDSL-type esterase/lipase family protein [Neptunitalea chrysea]GLB51597.1 lipase [Neptunitalea chrysea]